MPESVKELLSRMVDRFDPNAWGAQDAVLLFDISGEQGGQWVATVKGGTLTVNEGSTDAADMTLHCSDEDLVAMIKGELNPVSAFMQGKLKIDGDMALAMKLQNLLT